MVIPYLQEVKRNFVKGISYCGYSIYQHTTGGRNLGPRVKIEYNKVKGSDDYAIAASTTSDSPYIGMIAYSEHTGSRMSRYRNEGFVSQGDTISDLNYVNMLKDYGRYGYDLIHGLYFIYERDPANPEVIRIYNPSLDSTLPMLGIELDILEDNIPFQVFVQFDYRYPQIARIQDDGVDDGRLRLLALQQGALVSPIQYGVIPANAGDGWNTFTGTFSTFSTTATEGKAAVYLNRTASNGYVEVRNMTAYVLTDHPDKVRILGNTFNVNAIFDQFEQSRGFRPLTAPAKSTKLTRVKF